MSHVACIDIEITDLEALESACERLGWKLVKEAKTFKWFGKWVDDYHSQDAAYHHGINPEDYGKCAHKIKVPGCGYEIGLLEQEDGSFKAIFDFYDKKLEQAVGGKTCSKLKQLYGVEKTKKECIKKGFKVKEKKLKDGKLQLIVDGSF
jgi:hypothetical protein